MSTIKVREPGEGIARRKGADSSALKESILSENVRSEIRFLPLDRLVTYSKQARKKFDQQELLKLAYTITEYGIRNPLTVTPKDGDTSLFEIVSGERRYRAAQLAGLDKVPCIILHEPNKANEIALVENIQRVDLHPIELGNAYKDLLKNKQYTSATEVAEKVGISRSQVYEYLQYAELPDTVKEAVLANNITGRAFLRQLHECASESEMLALVNTKINTKEAPIITLPNAVLNRDAVAERSKSRRKRTKMSVLRIMYENGELIIDLKLKTVPKANLPEIKEALQRILDEIENRRG